MNLAMTPFSLLLIGVILSCFAYGNLAANTGTTAATIATTAKTIVATKPLVKATRQQAPECLQPLDAGPCRMNLERYYYNVEKNTCETFKFGGCRGNNNKFGFRQTCEEACVIAGTTTATGSNSKTTTTATTTTTTTTTTTKATTAKPKKYFLFGSLNAAAIESSDIVVHLQTEDIATSDTTVNRTALYNNEACYQPKETGRCFALFQRFAFNVDTLSCEDFIYGGCAGNKNNFETKEECESVCLKQETKEQTSNVVPETQTIETPIEVTELSLDTTDTTTIVPITHEAAVIA